jgi:hypothetical protein
MDRIPNLASVWLRFAGIREIGGAKLLDSLATASTNMARHSQAKTHRPRHRLVFYSIRSRLARLCRPHNIWMFVGSFEEPPFE